MNKRHTLTTFVVLLGIILLFAGSASAAVDFPADEAGISAYVKALSSIDLNDTKSAFASIERETSDYIIGTVDITWHSEQDRPHVYVSKDGWIVAYYPKEKSAGWIFPWYEYSGGQLSSTTLSKALGIVANAVGGTTNGLKYYDFRNPDASKMMIIIESTGGAEFYKLTVPTSFSLYAVDWSHYSSTSCSSSGNGYSRVYLDGASFTSDGCSGPHRSYGSLKGQIINGVEHEIKIATYRGTGRIGMVLEYAE
jgi:hypothetical protein